MGPWSMCGVLGVSVRVPHPATIAPGSSVPAQLGLGLGLENWEGGS